jgi:quercetin dioxygenase-like cupin family protein
MTPPIEIHADASQRAVMHGAQIAWRDSPMLGVQRRMLHRYGNEVAQATSLVRYAPGSHFSEHTHTGGEEFVVVEGVFQDEYGDYPVGSYIRNPPESRHTPRSQPGCTIFVKLWQFDLADRAHVKINMNQRTSVRDAARAGVALMPLFSDARENVRLETWEANACVALDLPEGGEFLLLEGDFTEGSDHFAPQSWLRLPRASRLQALAGPQGARVWVKTGHLRFLMLPEQVVAKHG